MSPLIFLLTVFMMFVAMPWIIFNSIGQWKRNGSLTREDEALLDELHELARRLDERVRNVERIVTTDNPNWREIASTDNQDEILRRIK